MFIFAFFFQEWEAGKQAEKDLVSEEIEKIRKSIQVLTSAANPLGKLFDFLQEDVDEMQRELQHWKNVNEKLRKQQKSELESVSLTCGYMEIELYE